MWLTKKFVMEDFTAEVKKGNYKKIDYYTWRELKELPDEWDLDIIYNLNNCSEEDSRYVTISWDGCNWPYEFRIKDGSLGEYIYNLIKIYDTPISLGLDTCTISDSLAKCAEAANKITKSWVSIGENLKNTPKLEIANENFFIDGKTIDQIINEALNTSENRKEKDSMNLFKNFDFGSCENDNVKMSIYGIAVKNAAGTWVSYDSKSGNVVDVDILNFSAKYLYKMPVAIKDIAVGDTVIHCRKPMFVTKIEDGKLLVIDPAAAEEKIVLPVKSPFGFDVYTKIVNLFGNLAAGASEDSPFGNMLPLILLADGDKTDNMLPLVFAMGGGKFDMSNPMMLYFLMSNGKANDNMLPLLFAMNNNCFSIPAPSAE